MSFFQAILCIKVAQDNKISRISVLLLAFVVMSFFGSLITKDNFLLAKMPAIYAQTDFEFQIDASDDDGGTFRFIHLYKETNSLFGLAGYLRDGEEVKCIESDDSWAKVEKHNGVSGWIAKSFVMPKNSKSIKYEKPSFSTGQELRINLQSIDYQIPSYQNLFIDYRNHKVGFSDKVYNGEIVHCLDQAGDFIKVQKKNKKEGWLLNIFVQ